MNITQGQVKAAFALVLFTTWVGLVVGRVVGAEDLISAIKYTLTALAAHYLTGYQSGTGVAVPTGQAVLK